MGKSMACTSTDAGGEVEESAETDKIGGKIACWPLGSTSLRRGVGGFQHKMSHAVLLVFLILHSLFGFVFKRGSCCFED